MFVAEAALSTAAKLGDKISEQLAINQSTLSGAIDVIVVPQPDGSLRCSPFHVRFGKLQLLKPREKVVRIRVNEDEVSLTMHLGYSGEAYFVDEAGSDDDDGSVVTETELANTQSTGASRYSSPVLLPTGTKRMSEPPSMRLEHTDDGASPARVQHTRGGRDADTGGGSGGSDGGGGIRPDGVDNGAGGGACACGGAAESVVGGIGGNANQAQASAPQRDGESKGESKGRASSPFGSPPRAPAGHPAHKRYLLGMLPWPRASTAGGAMLSDRTSYHCAGIHAEDDDPPPLQTAASLSSTEPPRTPDEIRPRAADETHPRSEAPSAASGGLSASGRAASSPAVVIQAAGSPHLARSSTHADPNSAAQDFVGAVQLAPENTASCANSAEGEECYRSCGVPVGTMGSAFSDGVLAAGVERGDNGRGAASVPFVEDDARAGERGADATTRCGEQGMKREKEVVETLVEKAKVEEEGDEAGTMDEVWEGAQVVDGSATATTGSDCGDEEARQATKAQETAADAAEAVEVVRAEAGLEAEAVKAGESEVAVKATARKADAAAAVAARLPHDPVSSSASSAASFPSNLDEKHDGPNRPASFRPMSPVEKHSVARSERSPEKTPEKRRAAPNLPDNSADTPENPPQDGAKGSAASAASHDAERDIRKPPRARATPSATAPATAPATTTATTTANPTASPTANPAAPSVSPSPSPSPSPSSQPQLPRPFGSVSKLSASERDVLVAAVKAEAAACGIAPPDIHARDTAPCTNPQTGSAHCQNGSTPPEYGSAPAQTRSKSPQVGSTTPQIREAQQIAVGAGTSHASLQTEACNGHAGRNANASAGAGAGADADADADADVGADADAELLRVCDGESVHEKALSTECSVSRDGGSEHDGQVGGRSHSNASQQSCVRIGSSGDGERARGSVKGTDLVHLRIQSDGLDRSERVVLSIERLARSTAGTLSATAETERERMRARERERERKRGERERVRQRECAGVSGAVSGSTADAPAARHASFLATAADQTPQPTGAAHANAHARATSSTQMRDAHSCAQQGHALDGSVGGSDSSLRPLPTQPSPPESMLAPLPDSLSSSLPDTLPNSLPDSLLNSLPSSLPAPLPPPPPRVWLCHAPLPPPWPPRAATQAEMEEMQAARVEHEAFRANPALLFESSLRVVVGDVAMSWPVAAPLLTAHLAFGTPLQPAPYPFSVSQSDLCEALALSDVDPASSSQSLRKHRRTSSHSKLSSKSRMAKPAEGRASRRSWFPWGAWGERRSARAPSAHSDDDGASVSQASQSGDRASSSTLDIDMLHEALQDCAPVNTLDQQAVPDAMLEPAAKAAAASAEVARAAGASAGLESFVAEEASATEGFFSSDGLEGLGPHAAREESARPRVQGERARKPARPLRKTTRPSAEQLKSLKLRPGCNAVRFTVHSSLQGKQELTASIYLLSEKERLVISDVDGTITKSDVLGHIYPRVGVDWSHAGVTALHSSITQNGYQLLYLTARGIGMATTTREYLSSVRQESSGGGGRLALPPGPCILSPSRLIESLTREVIRRNPEEFKIACLQEIRSLWPPEHNPFYAAFGNQPSDEVAYLAAGVPKSRILVINPNGAIRRTGTIYCWASYSRLLELVHEMFPPINDNDATPASDDFSSFNFWKPSLPALPSAEIEPVPSTERKTSGVHRRSSITERRSASDATLSDT